MGNFDQQQIDEALRLHREKQWQAAATAYRALLQQPQRANDPSLLSNLGDVLRNLGAFDEAIAMCKRAIDVAPAFAAAHGNLGIILLDQKRSEEAISHLRRAVELGLRTPALMMALGKALYEAGRFTEATDAFRIAAEQAPHLTEAWLRLGDLLRRGGKLAEAQAVLRQTLARRPESVEATTRLAQTLRDLFQLDEALSHARRAVELKPDAAVAHNMLATLLLDVGAAGESLHHLREALRFDPDHPGLHSNLLFQMHLDVRFTPQEIFDEHRRWAAKHAEPLAPTADQKLLADVCRDAERPLRIGYVSPDYSGHPVGRFILPVLRHHDRSHFHITCYADMFNADDTTRRLQAAADVWRPIAHLDHEQLARLVREDRIDILIDLTGHTARHRLLAFARRPAPVQVTYLGYPDTTGMRQIDWRITDALADPPQVTQRWHTERLFHLPHCAWCFKAHDESVPLEFSKTEQVTFGSFNTLAKTSDAAIDLWAKVLHAAPSSRMIIKTRGISSDEARRRLHQAFMVRGIEPGRLQLRPPVPRIEEHLAAYGEIDVALDTFPYVGTTTTCEALWMGTPVVTLAGQTHVSRVGVSLLGNAGLSGLIASDADEFIRIATDLAADADRRKQLRSNLRQMLAASPLMDAPGFTRRLEAAYRAMWRDYCERGDL